MLRNLGIRGRILSALALPVVVLALIGGLLGNHVLVQTRAADQTLQLARVTGGLTGLVNGLATERALSVGLVMNKPRTPSRKLAATRSAVNLDLTTLRTQIDAGDFEADAAIGPVVARWVAAHNQLAALRARTDAGLLPAEGVADGYSAIIAADLALPSDLAPALSAVSAFADQKAVATDFELYGDLARLVEGIAQEQFTGAERIVAGHVTDAAQRDLGAALDRQAQALAAFDRTAPVDRVQALTGTLKKSTAALQKARARLQDSDITQADWAKAGQAQTAVVTAAMTQIGENGVTDAQAAADSAHHRLLMAVGGAVLITLLALLAALAVGREIRKDGEPVPTEGSTDSEPAAVGETFVHVAGRSQVLLSRQLALIDQLERTQTDPEALDHLFRLDHLATRMRRNAESLLVLAGVESGRRLRRPMPLSDVVRTATSEIEHYSRVSLSLSADPSISAHLALPTAHLLAELLENATSASASVVVTAVETADGVRVVVSDDGPGMSDEEVAAATARIEELPTWEALGDQRLGFFVVGALARRLDTQVMIHSGPEVGTTVLIDLPLSLFVLGSTPAESDGGFGSDPGPVQVPQLLPVGYHSASQSSFSFTESSSDSSPEPSVPEWVGPADPFVPVAPAPVGMPIPMPVAMPTPIPMPTFEVSDPEVSDPEVSDPEVSDPEVSDPEVSEVPNPAFGPEFDYDPDYVPELEDEYHYRPDVLPMPTAETEAEYETGYETAYAPEYGTEYAAEHETGYATGYAPQYIDEVVETPYPVGESEPLEQSVDPAFEMLLPPDAMSGPIDILPNRLSIRAALMRGRRRPARPREESQESVPSQTFTRADGFADLIDPPVENVQFEGISAPVFDGPPPLPAPLLPWHAGEDSPETRVASSSESPSMDDAPSVSAWPPAGVVPGEEPQPVVESAGQRARTAANVRSMETGPPDGTEDEG